MKILSGKWSFYINGTLIALFIMLSLYLFDDTLGMSDGMLAVSEFVRESTEAGEIKAPPTLNWQLGLLGGILIGALASAIISGSWKIQFAPKDSGGIVAGIWKPIVQGIGGGFLVMLGLQIAGDSFWGQWAAAIQLSSGAWIFIITMFIVASAASILLDRYNEKGKGGE
jgi:Sulphur transport